MMNKRTIHFIAGARPNFMKIAPIVQAILRGTEQYPNSERNLQFDIVHTGQHYDNNMSKIFFKDLGIPEPRYNLEVGSGTHAEQTARIMIEYEKVLINSKPELIIVVGDVNSTIACSLTARKMGIPVGHVEAGLRSFDMEMPEEINRKLTDVISDLLFVTEESGLTNLRREGIEESRIHFVGNVMIDTLLKQLDGLDSGKYKPNDQIAKFLEQGDKYAVLTLHRQLNVDTRGTFEKIWGALTEISEDIRMLFLSHPRTKSRVEEFKVSTNRITTIDPIGYMDMLHAVRGATMVLTDSGGLQEETTVLGVPCITIRENTERPSTIEIGTNYLVGTDPQRIFSVAQQILGGNAKEGKVPPLWDGNAAERIVDVIIDYMNKSLLSG